MRAVDRGEIAPQPSHGGGPPAQVPPPPGGGHDSRGLPVLVELLDKGPMNLALQAEDLLSLIANEKGPNAPLGESAELRKKCHDAWQEWYNTNKATFDLAKVQVDSPFGSLA